MKVTICTYQSPEADHMIKDWVLAMTKAGRYVAPMPDADGHHDIVIHKVMTSDGGFELLYALPVLTGREFSSSRGLARADHLLGRSRKWDKALHFGRVPVEVMEYLSKFWETRVKRN